MFLLFILLIPMSRVELALLAMRASVAALAGMRPEKIRGSRTGWAIGITWDGSDYTGLFAVRQLIS
jgi:hypothetical protein